MDKPLQKATRTLRKHDMLRRGGKVLVGISGGADSVALVDILSRLADEFGITLCLAHVNHMARGEESDEDARFVSSLGKQMGLETFVENIDVKRQQGKLKASFQEAARILRYRVLESVAEKIGATHIAFGHTADDQAETVLMNLLRGSGLRGLAGIPPTRGKIIRPLIECFRAELEDYLRERGLAFRTDRSNASRVYLRNRIRLDLIPELESLYNKNLKAQIVETCGIIRDEEVLISSIVAKGFAECGVAQGDAISVDLEKLRQNILPLQRRLIREAIFHVKGDLRGVSAWHVQSVIALIDKNKRGAIRLPGFVEAVCGHRQLVFKKNLETRSSIKMLEEVESTELQVPGETWIAGIDLSLKATVITQNGNDYASSVPNRAYLDFDKTGDGIVSRFFRPGDSFKPLGMFGNKKVKTFFIDEKIPREERSNIPILTTQDGDIIWIYGRRISNTYRVTPETKRILFMEGKTLERTG